MPYDPSNPEDVRRLSEQLAAFQLVMEHALTAQRYWAGERIEHEGVRVWGDIVQRAAARQAAEEPTDPGTP